MTSDEDKTRYESFVRLLLEHEPQVRGYLRGLLPTWQDVEEVTQEASLVAWRKFQDFQDGTSFGGWLLTIARYEALKHRRKVARTPLLFSDEVWELLTESASSKDLHQIHREHLGNCLDKLEPSVKSLILRVHEPGVLLRDVAVQSGKSEQAFYKAIQRLRKSLLECVSKALAAEGM